MSSLTNKARSSDPKRGVAARFAKTLIETRGHILQPPAGLVILEQLGPAFQYDLAQDLGHRVQVLDRTQRHRLVQGRLGSRPARRSPSGR